MANQPAFRSIGAQLAVKTEPHCRVVVAAAKERARQGDRARRGTSTTFPLPGMIFGATVRSQIPRGRIKKITFGPGIEWGDFTIVSAKDIPGKNHIALITDDQPCLSQANS